MSRKTHSPILEKEIDRISLLPLASPSAFLSDQALVPDFQDSLRFAQRQHRFILDAIMRGEGTRAEALTREHARLALINFDYLKASRRQHAKDLPGLALVAND
jgi:GntR family transcriptional regulator of vanillate catabolism